MSHSDANNAGDTISKCDVIVVGAGFGGMYAVYKFREMGKSVIGVEGGGDVGGVWYWNRYPGARCDLMSVDYSYGFSPEIEQEWTWSEQFAAQPEILAYANFVADRLKLRDHYRFNTRVVSAEWNEKTSKWRATTDAGDVIEAPYCIMSTGPLSIPKDPDIPGIDAFKGELLRAQIWPHEPVSFEGKRVGVIGTGSTGIQIIQEVGRQAGELYVFQRTPSFTLPMRNRALEPEYVVEMKRHYRSLREAMRNNPTGGTRPVSSRPFFSLPPDQRKEAMEQAWINGGHTFLGSFGDLMINEEANEQVAEFVRSKIGDVVEDPATAEALKPRGYPIFARRPCLDTGYYETYNLPNVHLVDCLNGEEIIEITEKGVRTSAGEYELDMLIFATGYDALTGALMAIDVTGRDGVKIKDKWASGSRTHLGLMTEGFPNMFMTCGPNGPAALANIITISEHDVDWIADLMSHMEANGYSAAEPTLAAEDGWMDLVAALASRSLVRKAKTWWVGANVKGKPQGLTMYTGGFANYRAECAKEAIDYAGFRFDMEQVAEPAE
ncbi:NAD(P)/FAD-dependent oxidoreductase [Hoeflea sp. WL0058]|uniref:NAD(P)/FAD-dependent oxidoreductase n=1 Tax=Flavimaribacter sediminis TaxID=2865987 RepID=A0AAE2ZTM8_9HYPH|nr:NAD(P)/FAD-dependent oxidoreductase [Flavimaribacter sediminis]MBW8640681.1 NAD(P)/FAD-dependent oxidoreductase [Flavimaribacter sediminis]